MIDGLLFWESTDDYWEVPFFTEIANGKGVLSPNMVEEEDRGPAREALWAIREGLSEDSPTA